MMPIFTKNMILKSIFLYAPYQYNLLNQCVIDLINYTVYLERS